MLWRRGEGTRVAADSRVEASGRVQDVSAPSALGWYVPVPIASLWWIHMVYGVGCAFRTAGSTVPLVSVINTD